MRFDFLLFGGIAIVFGILQITKPDSFVKAAKWGFQRALKPGYFKRLYAEPGFWVVNGTALTLIGLIFLGFGIG